MTERTMKQQLQPGDLQDGLLSVQLKFTKLIGEGGMGQVWEAASDDLPGQRFAVKVVGLAHAQDLNVVSRFFGEARAAGAIDDPNIVSIHGTGRTHDGRPALVMTYIEGRSLADLCERGPLPLEIAAKILLQIASALRAAHGRNIVHRDIKLQNVMVMDSRWGVDWFVVLVDFGIAKFHDAGMAREIHTYTKQYIGTPGYSAPEQLLGKRVDAKADTYALGVLAYRILCGRAPYEAENYIELINLQLTGAPFPEPRELRADIPKEWNDLILLCLHRDPTWRPTASEFAKWVAAGISSGGSLLRSLAPRIAAEMQMGSKDETLSSDVPTALAQIQALTRQRRGKSSMVAAAVAAACVCFASTAVAFKVGAARGRAQAEPDAHVAASASPGPVAAGADSQPAAELGERATTARKVVPDATVDAAGGTAAKAPIAVATADAAAPRREAPTGGAAAGSTPAPRRVSAPTAGGAQASRRVAPVLDAPAPDPLPDDSRSPEEATTAKDSSSATPGSAASGRAGHATGAVGSLAFSAKTWADCFLVDGGKEVRLGTTPNTATLPVGPHRVRCTNEDQHQDETVTVTIVASKPTFLEKSW